MYFFVKNSCLRFGLNTYVYAPKDDAKHRSRWRDLYTNEESNELTQLIHLAKQNGLNFIYALSPGLDIIYSSEKDLIALKRKFDQVFFLIELKDFSIKYLVIKYWM
jgi:protein O-GlcNAcase/histone acetyltransferase